MIDSFCLWAPGLAAKTDWQDWICGKKNIDDSAESPKITFASPIVTRRFSQLTKMTCYMAHRLKLDTDMLFFTSARGEIDIQYKINTSFARENEVKPAMFTLSVFNTAPAEATILLKSKVPYCPIYSGFENAVRNLITVGCAPLISERLRSVMLIYAEERVPDEYRHNLSGPILPPLCVGIKVSGKDGIHDFPPESLTDAVSLITYLVEHKSAVWLE